MFPGSVKWHQVMQHRQQSKHASTSAAEMQVIRWKTYGSVTHAWTFWRNNSWLNEFTTLCNVQQRHTTSSEMQPSECRHNSKRRGKRGVKCSPNWKKKRDGSVPNKCHLSAHITGMLPAATDSFSLHLLHADSYPYWWLWLYSAESCSTTGSLAGLSVMSASLSLRYGLPGKSPFTSAWVPGGSMPVGSTVCRSGSVTSSSIRLLDAAVLSAAADCLSTDHWSRLPPQFGFVPEQQHQLPEPRC